MKYEKFPCAKCGRKIIEGYRTEIGIVCERCYPEVKPNNWLDELMKGVKVNES